MQRLCTATNSLHTLTLYNMLRGLDGHSRQSHLSVRSGCGYNGLPTHPPLHCWLLSCLTADATAPSVVAESTLQVSRGGGEWEGSGGPWTHYRFAPGWACTGSGQEAVRNVSAWY